MSIFAQKRPKYGEDPNFTPNTVIGEGVTLRGGVIKGVKSVLVNGLVFGNINVDGEVIVSETGYVKGDIVSTFAVISGIVEGNIHLTSFCSLKATASVTGDISCTAINIEDGAVFTGTCKMVIKSGAMAKKLKKINDQAMAIEELDESLYLPVLLEPDEADAADETENAEQAAVSEPESDITSDTSEWYSLEAELQNAVDKISKMPDIASVLDIDYEQKDQVDAKDLGLTGETDETLVEDHELMNMQSDTGNEATETEPDTLEIDPEKALWDTLSTTQADGEKPV